MIKSIKRIKSRVEKMTQWRPAVHSDIELEKYGTTYGEWVIPINTLSERAVCYLAGAGEDISFDIEIVQKYDCEAHIFDPTPRAKTHYESVVSAISEGEEMGVENSEEYVYSLSPEKLFLIHFHEIGLWNEYDTIKFYSPTNPDHV